MMQPISVPDLSQRPHDLTVERDMLAAPAVLYRAWTEQLDQWFAVPGTVLMKGEVNAVFFFETAYDGNRNPHYGRFLKLEPNRIVELTWLTRAGGTQGAEHVVTLELTPHASGTHLKLRHAGFPDAESRDQHEKAWHLVLE